MKKLLGGCAIGAAVALASAASAQTLNLSLGAGNAYVWRGLTLSDQAVVQGEASVGLPLMGGTFTTGVWASDEVSPRAGRFSSLTDFHPGVGEADFYAQLAHPAGSATLTLGVTALRFPEIREWNTFEVFASAALPNAPLAPGLIVRKDVDAVGGFYAEGNVSQAIASFAGHALVLSGVVGASTGQAEDGDLAWYAGEGITHVGLSASTSFVAGGLSVTPLIGVVHGVDDWSEVDGHATRLGASVTLSRSFPIRH